MSTGTGTGTAFRERTGLAWQRTSLSILGTSLVMLRLTAGRGGWSSVLLIVAGGLLGLVAAVESHRRSRPSVEPPLMQDRAAPHAGQEREHSHDGRLALLMSVAVTLLLVAELETVGRSH